MVRLMAPANTRDGKHLLITYCVYSYVYLPFLLATAFLVGCASTKVLDQSVELETTKTIGEVSDDRRALRLEYYADQALHEIELDTSASMQGMHLENDS